MSINGTYSKFSRYHHLRDVCILNKYEIVMLKATWDEKNGTSSLVRLSSSMPRLDESAMRSFPMVRDLDQFSSSASFNCSISFLFSSFNRRMMFCISSRRATASAPMFPTCECRPCTPPVAEVTAFSVYQCNHFTINLLKQFTRLFHYGNVNMHFYFKI